MDIDDYAHGLIEQLTDDARALGCEDELHRVSEIIRDGSSADRQVDHFRIRCLEGATEMEALHAVVDLLITETREGIEMAPSKSSV